MEENRIKIMKENLDVMNKINKKLAKINAENDMGILQQKKARLVRILHWGINTEEYKDFLKAEIKKLNRLMEFKNE